MLHDNHICMHVRIICKNNEKGMQQSQQQTVRKQNHLFVYMYVYVYVYDTFSNFLYHHKWNLYN